MNRAQRIRVSRSSVSLSALLLFVAVPSALAQTFTGGVRGTVHDAGGVIPGAIVMLTNEATNVSRETVTNDVGEFNFPAVTAGTYTVRASIVGYKTFARRSITVATQQFITVDVVLEVGTVEDAITVTADVPLIDTARADTGGVLDRQALESLPAPGRNAFLIGVVTPTFNAVGDPQFNRQQDQTNASRVSLGGGGIRANNYLIDGVAVTELAGRSIVNPTIEAIEDTKVQVHTYDAEMGRTGGGVFNTTFRSGTNAFHGSGFFQSRPVRGLAQNFFNERAGLSRDETGESDQSHELWGGGGGGPIIKDRAFFWVATENYRLGTTRNLQEVWPGVGQRRGDFSASTIGGQSVRLFNPWCRGGAASARCPTSGTGSLATGGEFTNAVIPLDHPAVSQVARNVLDMWPAATTTSALASNEDGDPNASGTALLRDEAEMFTFKADFKLNESWTVSGFHVYNDTDEPGSSIMDPSLWFMADQSEFFGPLRRRPRLWVVNTTGVLSDSMVVTGRWGWYSWQDQLDTQSFTPGLGSLGFSDTFVNAVAEDEVFPSLTFDQVEGVGGWGGNQRVWRQPWTMAGSLTWLRGNHSFKFGGEARKLSITTTTEEAMGGSFAFDERFTSLNGAGGHELASFLLGLPSSGSAPVNRGLGEWFVKYYGAFVQDEWRVTPRLTLSYGVRLEHEDGLRELDNQQTVGFDTAGVNPIDALVPKTGLLAGRTISGGLIFAGVDGAPEEQGDPLALEVAPRMGATFSLNDDTVVRSGFGVFWAPWQYSTTEHGQIGFSRDTAFNQSSPESELPLTTLDDPFSAGLQQPFGSSLAMLTGIGGDINFVDQDKGSPRVYQYSVDIQRQLGQAMAVTLGYQGATGRDLGFGGTNNASININQIDPAVAAEMFPAAGGGWDPVALRQSVANPFFGIPEAGELGTRPTIQQGQLLRPFPQFGNVNKFEQTTGGKRQFHAVSVLLDKRLSGEGWMGVWGGRFSYTWSRTMDNQFCETNTFTNRTCSPQNNYDLDAEYSRSIFDVPHRVVLAPVVKIPGPSRSSGLLSLLLDGWSASSIVELMSGGPLNATLSASDSEANLGLFGGRQRPNLVGDPGTSGGDTGRVATATDPDARFFTNDAFENPGSGVLGTAPRTISDTRHQFRKNLDVVLAKDTRFPGGHTFEVRVECLNCTNTPKFRGPGNDVFLSSFGRVTSQAGFMRIMQITLRYKF